MIFKNRFAMGDAVGTIRKDICHATVEFVTGANAQCIEAIEHIQLGDAQTGKPVDLGCTLQRRRIEPAATTWATGDRAELIAALAQAFANIIFKFGWKRA